MQNVETVVQNKDKEFRAWCKKTLPHVRVRGKTVDFTDLARGAAVVYTIAGATHREDVFEASAKAKELGLVFSYGAVTLPSRGAQ